MTPNYNPWHEKTLSNGWVEITTPYLDRHNDYIQIYLRQTDNQYYLSDDGYTIDDMMQSGTLLESETLRSTLEAFGAELLDEAVVIKSSNVTLGQDSLVHAILTVNALLESKRIANGILIMNAKMGFKQTLKSIASGLGIGIAGSALGIALVSCIFILMDEPNWSKSIRALKYKIETLEHRIDSLEQKSNT